MDTRARRLNGLSLLGSAPRLLACCLASLFSGSLAWAEISEAVSTSVSDAYVRTKLPGGSYLDETYSFGEGGHLAAPVQDDSIDQTSLMDVARAMVPPLALRNYVPVPDKNPANTRLLIMVYWGTTRGTAATNGSDANRKLQDSQANGVNAPPPPESSFIAHCTCDTSQVSTNFTAADNVARQGEISSAFAVVAAQNKVREQADMWNAVLLGYDTELATASRLQLTAFRSRRDDLTDEIEQNRDFIVLKAYDFQALWKKRQHKLLWITRLSVRERGTNFAASLPTLARTASDYFGRDTHGLIHQALSEDRVEIGDIKSLGVVPMK
jgi:hypothetical protein